MRRLARVQLRKQRLQAKALLVAQRVGVMARLLVQSPLRLPMALRRVVGYVGLLSELIGSVKAKKRGRSGDE